MKLLTNSGLPRFILLIERPDNKALVVDSTHYTETEAVNAARSAILDGRAVRAIPTSVIERFQLGRQVVTVSAD